MIHAKWVKGALVIYDGANEILTIHPADGGVEVGNLAVENATISGDAVVEGNASVGGDLAVAGAVSAATAAVAGDASVGGAVSAASAAVEGDVSVGGNAAVTGDAEVGGALGVTGNATVGGDATVTGAASVGGDLAVTGAANVGSLAIGGETVTATPAELNLLAGAVAENAEGLAQVRVARAVYDVAVHGGAQGTIALPVSLPANAIILDGVLDVLTPLAGEGASVAVQAEGEGDIVAAAAVADEPWATSGLQAIVPDGTAAKAVKCSEARAVSVVIADADLTAGAFCVILRYVVSA